MNASILDCRHSASMVSIRYFAIRRESLASIWLIMQQICVQLSSAWHFSHHICLFLQEFIIENQSKSSRNPSNAIKNYNDLILNNINDAIIGIDEHQNIIIANNSALNLLQNFKFLTLNQPYLQYFEQDLFNIESKILIIKEKRFWIAPIQSSIYDFILKIFEMRTMDQNYIFSRHYAGKSNANGASSARSGCRFSHFGSRCSAWILSIKCD